MKALIFFGLLAVLILVGCKTDDDGIACTQEFRTVGCEVIGKPLDRWYTVRNATDDTLNIGTKFENTYAVLDDNFQRTLQGKQDTFTFHGVISDSVWVKEPFVISADECHINYVSGKLRVEL